MSLATGTSRDRVVLISGGAGQLGRHVVHRFLANGDRIHVPAFNREEEASLNDFLGSDSTSVHTYAGSDLSDPEDVEALVRAIREEEGRGPEVLLNLAGGFWMGSIEETDPDSWNRMWQINATTAFLCARAVFPGMSEAGWGRIINVSAFPALDRGKAGLTAYGAAKAAVLNLTQTLAREGVAHGVTVNAILPSIIDTPANRKAMPDADPSSWIPPTEIAEVLAFLASPEAHIINGAAIPLTLG